MTFKLPVWCAALVVTLMLFGSVGAWAAAHNAAAKSDPLASAAGRLKTGLKSWS